MVVTCTQFSGFRRTTGYLVWEDATRYEGFAREKVIFTPHLVVPLRKCRSPRLLIGLPRTDKVYKVPFPTPRALNCVNYQPFSSPMAGRLRMYPISCVSANLSISHLSFINFVRRDTVHSSFGKYSEATYTSHCQWAGVGVSSWPPTATWSFLPTIAAVSASIISETVLYLFMPGRRHRPW